MVHQRNQRTTLELDSSVPLTHHDPRDLGLICVVKKCKFHFQICSDLRIQSWIFLTKGTLNYLYVIMHLKSFKVGEHTPDWMPYEILVLIEAFYRLTTDLVCRAMCNTFSYHLMLMLHKLIIIQHLHKYIHVR